MSNELWALAGVRVLDLADETAVFGTKLLADLGADVIRVEPPEGDPIRRLGPFAGDIVDPERSLSQLWFNSSKRSVTLDLGTAAGRARLAGLAAGADILVETGDPSLDLAAYRSTNPGLTILSVSGYGRTGPRREWQVPGLIAWAISGAMSITGLADRYPLHANWALGHHVVGLHVAIGALSGLYHARTTGRGVHFDLSRIEALASMHATLTTLYSYNNGFRQIRQGVENRVAAPYGAFPTADGEVILIALTMAQWQGLLDWMAEIGPVDAFLLNPEFQTMGGRSPHQQPIHEALGRWTRQFRTDELVAEANRRRIPCAPINSPLDILDDSQLRARGYFVPVEVPALGHTVEVAGLPYQFSEGGGRVLPPPQRGDNGADWRPRDAAPPQPSPILGGETGWLSASPDPPNAEEERGRLPASPDPRAAREAARADQPAPLLPQNWGRPEGGLPDPWDPALDPAAAGWPLAGLKVLDLTWAMAGPQGTRALGDLGARVVKIEPREVGDIVRGLPPHWQARPDMNQSGFFHRLNRNKRNLTVDLKQPDGIALVKRLAAWADVIVDNFGCGVMERLGLGAEVLVGIKPELVRVSLSGYGQEGPTRHYPSFALISQARGGIVYSTAYPGGPATGDSLNIGDTGASLQLAIVILAALEQARRLGRGMQVDMSQLEAATVFIGPALLEASVNGRSFIPNGNQLPDRTVAPHHAYPTRGDDRWIAIAALTEDHWRRLAAAMGRPDLATDPLFATAADRVAHLADLDALIADWTRDQDAETLAERLQVAGVPAGSVQDAAQILEQDPQLQFRRFYQTVEQPEIGPIPMDTNPLRWTDDPVPILTAGPLIGEHNEFVLREVLGLSEEEIVELVVGEVI